MPNHQESDIVSQDPAKALVGGCYQILLGPIAQESGKANALPALVNFTLPSGVRRPAKGFARADGTAMARCYVNEPGLWSWEAKTLGGRGIASGSFQAQPSKLPGKLRISKIDSRQFVYESGAPFLHLGDTQYRLLAPAETRWQACIDQAAQVGFTKIRAWLPSSESDCSNFYDPNRKDLDLAFWDEAESRLLYALHRSPQIQFQLCLFAKDRQSLERYEEGDPLTHLATLYAIERLGSLPNVHWSLASDIDPAKDNAVTLQALSRLGKALSESPAAPLVTCGQVRHAPFLFARENWCAMTALGSLGQVTGQVAQEQRPLFAKPIVFDEDRAEHSLAPISPRYYFRRLFWGLLFSGAHPTYEGLDTRGKSTAHKSGVYGYYDACHAGRLSNGAHDLLNIRKFFNDLNLTLEGWVPDDAIGGGRPLQVKSIRSATGDRCALYIANPDAHAGHSGAKGKGFYSDQNAAASDIFTTFNLELPFSQGVARWFSPVTGKWGGEVEITKSSTIFLTPEPGDWVLWAERSQPAK